MSLDGDGGSSGLPVPGCRHLALLGASPCWTRVPPRHLASLPHHGIEVAGWLESWLAGKHTHSVDTNDATAVLSREPLFSVLR